MAYVRASHKDVVGLLTQGNYEVTKENIYKALHLVFGFDRTRRGEFGIEDSETALYDTDIGKKRWFSVDAYQHKTLEGEVVVGLMYIGYERKDEDWIQHGRPSEEVKMEIRNDPSYNALIAGLSRRRTVS